MKKAGCVSVNLAIESGDEYILNKVIRKGLSLNKIREVAKICNEIGLIANGYFVLGMPGETKESITKTIKFTNILKLDKIAMSYATPFPGTELYDECIAKKYISPEYIHNIENYGFILYNEPVIITKLLSKKELIKLRSKFFFSFSIYKVWQDKGILLKVITDKQFRAKVFTALKRYGLGK
jgi:radical SAM superfamily enzyme YgiQ (UPF0313 family)